MLRRFSGVNCGILGLLCLAAGAAASIPHRVLWTWDNRMEWGGSGTAVSIMGGGLYRKTPEAYLQDYKALIDYMQQHTSFNAVIIWGFLRDEHGGVAAAQELCAYAQARGIRILPGVGTSGYEGYYYSGNHLYNISTWLRQHPELRAIDAHGKPHNALCPTHPENIKWLQEGCRWLLQNFGVGGINFEIGDFFVCHCERCRQARAAIADESPDYYKDMALSIAAVADTALSLSPQGWHSYATYTGFTAEMQKHPPAWIHLIPEQIICQWTLTGMLGEKWPVGLRPPTKRNWGYVHWGNKSTHTRHHIFLERIRQMCRRAQQEGFEGLVTYGEDPPTLFSMRLFYEAWSAFMEHPEWEMEDFLRERLAQWLDSLSEARKLLSLLLALERQGLTRQGMSSTLAVTKQALGKAPNERAKQTWQDFHNFLQTQLAEIEAEDVFVSDPVRVEEMKRAGFVVKQGTKTTLILPKEAAETIEIMARVHLATENGLLPVLRLTFNGVRLDPTRAIGRPEQIATPQHEAYKSLSSFEPASGAWRLKYDNDWEINAPPTDKYYTPDYSPIFRFRLGDLWREGENRLEIENLEERFRPSENGVLHIKYIQLK